ncbi:MAG: hypothetical protein QOH46_2604 [Solirubrobacteraceae bacterium]|nr:hypothetical protein [Solirubrobacteraceae bacterium]
MDAAAGARYRRATMVDVNAYAGLLEAIETRFESEAALDELERHVNTDGRLTADDREHLRGASGSTAATSTAAAGT